MVDELVILPCHSVWKTGPTLGDNRDEWFLAGFQYEGNDHICFKDHIIRSLEYLRENQNSYLVISGGQTKKEAGPISEALSYYQLACELNKDKDLLERVTTEEFARDSLENVIFSICRFYEMFGRYPRFITVIGFEFKRDRFIKNHLKKALAFPEDGAFYIGNKPDPKHLDEEGRKKYFDDLAASEHKFALSLFEDDWYGLRQSLMSKKKARNPFKRHHGYAQSNEQLADFMKAIEDDSSFTNEEVSKKIQSFWEQ